MAVLQPGLGQVASLAPDVPTIGKMEQQQTTQPVQLYMQTKQLQWRNDLQTQTKQHSFNQNR